LKLKEGLNTISIKQYITTISEALKMKRDILFSIILMCVLAVGCSLEKPIGGETDEHGCLSTAGYTWCESKQKCLRTWEEDCSSEISGMTLEEAMEAAQNTECTEKGDLTENSMYNKDTKTWWIDLDMKEEFKKDICNPACVVKEMDNTAEINWRCMGVLPPVE